LRIGDNIQISEVEEFDKSLTILHKKTSITLSNEAAFNLLVA
jgi:DtxR family transcriptional regulator, Mn-dependent transcriptional regulator